MARRIGFNCSAVEEADCDLEEVAEEATLDLHDELVKAINTLVIAIRFYKGSIKGISISADSNGSYSTKIKY